MAIVKEEFVRCENCGNADFEIKEVVTLPKGLPRRQDFEKTNQLPVLEHKYIYYCSNCKTPVD